MKKFQIILMIVFGIGALFAVLVFAGYIPTPAGKSAAKGSGTVVIWGTESSTNFVQYMTDLADGIQDFRVVYIPKDPTTYESDLIQAFADGKAPDLFFVTNSNMLRFSAQIEPVSYSVLSQKKFLESYAPAFTTFLSARGITAYPFLIDPMVLYYNKTLLANDGVATPPVYWDEFNVLAEKLTKRDTTGTFVQSTIPLGRFENNANAKDIFVLLLQQVGNPIVSINSDGFYVSTLGSHRTGQGLSLPAVTGFFTDFASPDKFVYSWNKALPDARSSFLTERVVFYPGFSSELFTLQARNPNLSLAMTDIPQPRGVVGKKTYARITGLALSKNSTNKYTALLTMQTLGSPYHAGNMAKIVSLPSVYTTDLKQNPDPSLAYQGIIQSAALRAVSFRDPSSSQTLDIFNELTQSILAGGADSDGAYERADGNLNFLLNRFNQSAGPSATVIPTQ